MATVAPCIYVCARARVCIILCHTDNYIHVLSAMLQLKDPLFIFRLFIFLIVESVIKRLLSLKVFNAKSL